MRGASEFNGCESMTNDNGDFWSHKTGMWGDNGGADNVVCFVGDEFDEAVFETVDVGRRKIGEFDDNFFVLTVAFDEIVFIESNGDYFWIGTGKAYKTLIINRGFGVIDKVISYGESFLVSAFGR